METSNRELYFDPFADEQEQLFDPVASFAKLEKRYLEKDIKHDYTADTFVRDTEALMLDATFIEQFDAVQAMAYRMHELCGEDHALNQASQGTDMLSSFMSGHEGEGGVSLHGHGHEDDEYEIDPKTGKKTKKKKRYGWFGLLLR